MKEAGFEIKGKAVKNVPDTITLLIVVLMSSILLSGCVIVRPAAKTLVSVQRNDNVGQEWSFGLRHAYWTENVDGIHFAAYGWHPRA